MLTVLPENDKALIEEYFSKTGLTADQNSRLVVARLGDEVLGYCAFKIENDTVTVLEIEPKDDIMLFDGILRSALHVASEAFIFNAKYESEKLEPLFEQIAFIKDKADRTLLMDKLFGGCCCGENK